MAIDVKQIGQRVEKESATIERIRTEVHKVIVGQEAVIEELLIALFAGGHCLLTGAPGLAKTLLIRTLAAVFHLELRSNSRSPPRSPTR